METLFQQILNLLIQPPGNLIYHLVLAFSVVSSLQAAWIGRQNNGYQHAGRLVFGLTMLLIGQAVLFLSSGLAWQGMLDSHLFLPVLDRAIILFSLVWIVWLWNFPTPARLGDLVTGFLILGVVILFVFTYTSWQAEGGRLPFNNSWMDWVWEYAGLFVVLTGLAMLLFTRPSGWGFGLGMLGLSLAGFVAHLTLPSAGGDFSGYIRIGQLAAFPLLTTLLNRFTIPVVQGPAVDQPPAASLPVVDRLVEGLDTGTGQNPQPFPRDHERRRYSTDPRTLHALLDLINTTEPEKIITGLPKAIGQTMLADLCFLVNGPNYGHIVLQSGYDLIREETMTGTMLDQNSLPALAGALQRAKPLRVLATDTPPADIKTLAAALGLKEVGSLLYVPLTLNDKPQGGILFLSPYSNRQWTIEDQGYLSSEVELIARLLQRAQQPVETQPAANPAADRLTQELENLKVENRQLLSDLYDLRQAAQAAPAVQPAEAAIDLTGLLAVQEEAQEQIAALQADNERLQNMLSQGSTGGLPPETFEQMENELRVTLQELAGLQNQLAEANARNLQMERDNSLTLSEPNEDQEVIVSIVQELRQPMSSIIGYTDLLLTETVGILGALQRQFLERIKASAERMRTMMQDLIQVTALNEGGVELLPQSFELGAVIDSAVEETSGQLREKNIALRVDLPDEMPRLYADRDALQQIVLHLLQNAGTVTTPEGTITLRGKVQKETDANYLLLQVIDSGGGIQPDDLPRVFSRRFRADLPLIQGLGDTGAGLSIAKTLAEAQGGRIWVESTPGEATTFSVLLPIQPNHKDSHTSA